MAPHIFVLIGVARNVNIYFAEHKNYLKKTYRLYYYQVSKNIFSSVSKKNYKVESVLNDT